MKKTKSITQSEKPKLIQNLYLLSTNEKSWLYSNKATKALTGVLSPHLLSSLLHLLDGNHTVTQIAKTLKINSKIVLNILEVLNDNKFLDENESSVNAPQDSPVLVIDSGILGESGDKQLKTLINKFEWFNFQEKSTPSKNIWNALLSHNLNKLCDYVTSHQLIVLASHAQFYLLSSQLNEVCLKLKIPLMLVRVHQSIGTIATVWPFKTACATCGHLWRKATGAIYEEELALDAAIAPDMWKGLEPELSIKRIITSFTLAEINRFVKNKSESLTTLKGEWEIDFLSLKTTMHPILKNPRCPSCGLINHTPPQKEETLSEIWAYDRRNASMIIK